MSDKTPRTDAFYKEHPICEYEERAHPEDCCAWLAFARIIETELTAAKAEIERLERGGAIELPARIIEMCHKRGWSLHWTCRGAYLHLESSELIEAIRGKHGDPMKEAADVLLVLMSITENAGIPWEKVMEQARATCEELMTKPRYSGEEHAAIARAK